MKHNKTIWILMGVLAVLGIGVATAHGISTSTNQEEKSTTDIPQLMKSMDMNKMHEQMHGEGMEDMQKMHERMHANGQECPMMQGMMNN